MMQQFRVSRLAVVGGLVVACLIVQCGDAFARVRPHARFRQQYNAANREQSKVAQQQMEAARKIQARQQAEQAAAAAKKLEARKAAADAERQRKEEAHEKTKAYLEKQRVTKPAGSDASKGVAPTGSDSPSKTAVKSSTP